MSTSDHPKTQAPISSHVAHFCHWLKSQTGSNLIPKNAFPSSGCDKKMAAECLPPFSDQVDFVNRHGGR